MATLRNVNGILPNEGQRSRRTSRFEMGVSTPLLPVGDLPTDRTIDASGMLILPGMIDDQVHPREPGLEQKGDLGSGSREAVAGGIPSCMDMWLSHYIVADKT